MSPHPEDIERARRVLDRTARNLRGAARYAPSMRDPAIAIHVLATSVRNARADVLQVIDLLKGSTHEG